MGALSSVVSIVALIVLVLLMALCVRIMAKVMETGKTSYMAALGAVLMTYAVSAGLGALTAAGAGANPLLATPVAILLSLFIFSRVLQTTLFRGFIISVMAGVMSALIITGAFFVFGGAALWMGTSSSLSDMENMSGSENMDCVETVTRSADGTRVRTSVRCSSGTTSFDGGSESGTATPAEDVPASTEDATAEPQAAERPKARRFAYQETDVDFLPGQIGRDVKIYTKDGREHAGRLTAVDDDIIRVEKRMRGGSMEFFVRKPEVESVQVLDEVL